MKFYAIHHPYGNMALSAHGFRAFDSQKERDDFVAENELRDGNVVWEVCTRRNVEKELGKDFIIDNMGSCKSRSSLY